MVEQLAEHAAAALAAPRRLDRGAAAAATKSAIAPARRRPSPAPLIRRIGVAFQAEARAQRSDGDSRGRGGQTKIRHGFGRAIARQKGPSSRRA